MQYVDERNHLRVEFNPKCKLPADELTRMERSLEPLGEAVREFPSTDLCFTITNHENREAYHVKARLRLPGRSLFTGDYDPYLDSAYQRCLNKLLHMVQAYRERPNGTADALAPREGALDRDIVAPEAADAGPVGEAVQTGNYKRFRDLMSGYEEWLRKRVGRWVQRYPEVEAQIGKGLLLGDLLEEVYLNAFERYPQRPAAPALHEWLEGLIDPSLQMFLRHPDDEKENVSLARTLRETRL
jgi:hypothetical protein